MNNDMKKSLTDFKRCVEESPEGTYDDAKRLNEVIGETCDNLMREVRDLGLKADACDLIFALEAAIYDYVKRSNPESTLFPVAEGFGSSMDGPARDRVLSQAAASRDFFQILRSVGATPKI